MKNNFLKLLSSLLLLSIIGLNTVTVKAYSFNDFQLTQEQQSQINIQIANDLNSFAQENDINVTFENLNFNIDYNLIKSQEDLELEISEAISQLKSELINLNTSIESKQKKNIYSGITPFLVNNGSYYTARVENIIPAIGWGYVNQDFNAIVSSGYIRGITLLGDSYKTGVTLSGWTPVRSWYNISSNSKYAQIYMKGIISYIFKGSNIDTAATFKETLGTNGNSALISVHHSEYPN